MGRQTTGMFSRRKIQILGLTSAIWETLYVHSIPKLHSASLRIAVSGDLAPFPSTWGLLAPDRCCKCSSLAVYMIFHVLQTTSRTRDKLGQHRRSVDAILYRLEDDVVKEGTLKDW